jgi:hypothetical protein
VRMEVDGKMVSLEIADIRKAHLIPEL